MVELVGAARIVITHGGPSSFIMPLQIGKTPLVVPRQKKYEEHVNDHQVNFCHQVEERMGTIIVLDDVEKLGSLIESVNENKKTNKNPSNNAVFCDNLENLVDTMLFGDK